MRGRSVLAIVFLLLSIVTAIVLYKRIDDKNQIIKDVKANEELVKLTLLAYGDLQKLYLSSNKEYAHNWEELQQFVNQDTIFDVEKKEHVETLNYGADSVWYTYDTLGFVLVKDFVSSENKFKYIDFLNVGVLPHASNLKFELYAGKIENGVNVFEVVDSSPFNLERRKEGSLPPLKIGSRVSAITKGNWEK